MRLGMWTRAVVVSAVVLLLLLMAGNSFAQEATAAFTGTVTDASGAAVTGATVSTGPAAIDQTASERRSPATQSMTTSVGGSS